MSTPFNPFGNVNDDDSEDSVESISFGNSEPSKQEEVQPVQPVQQQDFKPEKKYNIIDQYWLINSKLFVKEKLNPGEIQLITIGYNADFNNMRIALYETNGNTFTETAIHKYNAKQITTVNIFSETVEQLMFNISAAQSGTVYNFERIFSEAMTKQDWKPSQAIFDLDAKEGSITLKVKHNNNELSYKFIGWQLKALLNSFKFMLNGNAWIASLK